MEYPLRASIRQVLANYFERQVRGDPEEVAKAKVAWRLSCFDHAGKYIQYVEQHYFAITDRVVLDAACAWGGHAMALASAGAHVYASDLTDHSFPSLRLLCRQQGLNVRICRANCERLPYATEQFDLILGLELLEHIESVESFAEEVARLLRPGGVAVLSTPPRFRSLIEGEPHYGIRGLTILPLFLQRWVATRVFNRNYPFPIPRQYTCAASILRPFRAVALSGRPVLQGAVVRRLSAYPRIISLSAQFFWNFIVVEKPQHPSQTLHSS